MAIQDSFYVKIAGPENEVSGWMSSSVQEQSHQKQFPPRTFAGQAMVTQRLAALRSHGSRFGIWKAIKPPLFASFREHLPSTDLSLRKA